MKKGKIMNNMKEMIGNKTIIIMDKIKIKNKIDKVIKDQMVNKCI